MVIKSVNRHPWSSGRLPMAPLEVDAASLQLVYSLVAVGRVSRLRCRDPFMRDRLDDKQVCLRRLTANQSTLVIVSRGLITYVVSSQCPCMAARSSVLYLCAGWPRPFGIGYCNQLQLPPHQALGHSIVAAPRESTMVCHPHLIVDPLHG